MKTKAPKKDTLVKAAIALPIILAAIFTGIYFNLSGIFRDAPKIEVQPLNNFKKTLHVVTRLRCGNDERSRQPLADES